MPGALGPEALTTNFIARNVSSACNSSGSVIWASAKNIKPLVDANCHTEAIEVASRQSLIRFVPIHYRNPGSGSRSPSGQTILFGCPLELQTVGELKKIPPVLEYLLDSVHAWPNLLFDSVKVGQKHRNCPTNSLYNWDGELLAFGKWAWTSLDGCGENRSRYHFTGALTQVPPYGLSAPVHHTES